MSASLGKGEKVDKRDINFYINFVTDGPLNQRQFGRVVPICGRSLQPWNGRKGKEAFLNDVIQI